MEVGKGIMSAKMQERDAKRRSGNRRTDYVLLAVLFLVACCGGIYFALQTAPVQKNYLYPYPYKEIVDRYAERYEIDPYLAAAVIKSESNFRQDVHSHRGAIGLMQLMPDTAEWIASRLEDDAYSETRLHEPDCNIQYGIWYLAHLEQDFDGNKVLSLAAYNAGRGNVEDWIKEYRWGMDFNRIDEIPYEETRLYVERVLRYEKKYRELYGDADGSH